MLPLVYHTDLCKALSLEFSLRGFQPPRVFLLLCLYWQNLSYPLFTYLELLRRGYRVSVGKVKDMQVDFVARKDDRTEYYQVTANMTDENTFEREIRLLRLIADNYPKMILTLDRFTLGNYVGIEVRNAADWLMQ